MMILNMNAMNNLFFPDSLGLWVSGRYCDQPGSSAWSPADPLYQEALFP